MCVVLDGTDYSGGSRLVSFVPGGPNIQCVSYPILGDDVMEGNEEFAVILTALNSSSLFLSPTSATVFIVDDDCEFKNYIVVY